MIQHAARDRFKPNTLLFATDLVMYSYDLQMNRVIKLAGQRRRKGAINGDYTRSTFRHISHFIQLSFTEIIVVDSENHCLRTLNPAIRDLTAFAGRCDKGSSGTIDGTALLSRFNNPLAIELASENLIFVLDKSSHRLRKLVKKQIDGWIVATIAEHLPGEPLSIGIDISGKFLYITTKELQLLRWDVELEKYTQLFRAGKGYSDGNFQLVKFESMHSVVATTDNVLIICDRTAQNLRVISLADRSVTSICKDRTGNLSVGDISMCSLLQPIKLSQYSSSVVITLEKAIFLLNYKGMLQDFNSIF